MLFGTWSQVHAYDPSTVWRPGLTCSLGHRRKYMLTILPTIWRPGLVVSNHGEMSVKFLSGTSRAIEKMRLVSFFYNFLLE